MKNNKNRPADNAKDNLNKPVNKKDAGEKSSNEEQNNKAQNKK